MATVPKAAREPARRYVISRAQFAAISAVEGLKLTAAGEQRLKATQNLSPELRRSTILAAYTRARGR